MRQMILPRVVNRLAKFLFHQWHSIGEDSSGRVHEALQSESLESRVYLRSLANLSPIGLPISGLVGEEQIK